MNQGCSQHRAALGTMILLDPDLDPDPAPKTTLAKRAAASAAATKSSKLRLPSARTLSRFLATAQKAVRLKGQVTVLLTTDAAIRGLNRRFRGKNKATDVLSFPAEGLGAEGIAGDVAISVTTALRQAAGQGHSLSTEIKVLILHGLLHLAGYDHEADDGKMARRERLLRGRLGLPQGLIERAAQKAFPQGLKPGPSLGRLPARLKSCPFKAGMNEVRGIPPLPQKQKRGKDGAPSPFKAGMNEVRGIPPLPQKQERGKDGAPSPFKARMNEVRGIPPLPQKQELGKDGAPAKARPDAAALIVGVKTPTYQPVAFAETDSTIASKARRPGVKAKRP